MPRFRLTGRNRGLEAVLDAHAQRGLAITRVFSQGDDVVVRVDREDAGELRRAWTPCVELDPQYYRAAILHEARAALAWHGERRDTIQAAITDATQYAVRAYAHGEGTPEGCALVVVCYYGSRDAVPDEPFTLAARYAPDEGGWVEVL